MFKKNALKRSVDISPAKIVETEMEVIGLIERLKSRDFVQGDTKIVREVVVGECNQAHEKHRNSSGHGEYDFLLPRHQLPCYSQNLLSSYRAPISQVEELAIESSSRKSGCQNHL